MTAPERRLRVLELVLARSHFSHNDPRTLKEAATLSDWVERGKLPEASGGMALVGGEGQGA